MTESRLILTFNDIVMMEVGTGFKLLQDELGSMCCSHLDMELSEVRSLGERIVLKLRLGCDTAQHEQTKSHSVNEASARKTAMMNTTVSSGV